MTSNRMDSVYRNVETPWKHRRRSILHDAPQHWVGWDRIMELYRHALTLKSLGERLFHSLYFSTLFLTGSRISEVLRLRPGQIHWNDEIIKIENMEVLKRRRRFTRNVIIKIEDNPLTLPFIDHVEDCDTRYLLPGFGVPGGRTIDPNSMVSRVYVYERICEIDPDVWPHWIRDQRSWHLSAEIEQDGRGFDSYELKEWYAWASMDMPAHYAGRRGEEDILRKLGIQDIQIETQ